jgi:hypothetical protein
MAMSFALSPDRVGNDLTDRMQRRSALVAACLLVFSSTGSAQSRPPESSSQSGTSQPVGLDDLDDARTDLFDLIRKLREKPPEEAVKGDRRVVFTIVPIIGAKPTTGFRAGAGANIEFALGDPTTTRISVLNGDTTISSQGQFGAGAVLLLYGPHNRWKFEGRNSFKGARNGNVVLGTRAGPGGAPEIDYDSVRLFNTYLYRVWRQLYAGAGLSYARQAGIEPDSEDAAGWDSSPFVTYSTEHAFTLSTQTAAGPGILLLIDSRDNQNDAFRGWYFSSEYSFNFKNFLGGDSSWSNLYTDVRTYKVLSRDRRHRLAFWVFGDFVTSGRAPYLSLPTTGGDPQGRSARGYAEGHFRGERLVYGEAEYRATVTGNGFLGVVSFLNVTTASNEQTSEKLFDAGAVAGGVGLRFLLRKRSRTNICLDFGWGRHGSFGVYLGLGDAF